MATERLFPAKIMDVAPIAGGWVKDSSGNCGLWFPPKQAVNNGGVVIEFVKLAISDYRLKKFVNNNMSVHKHMVSKRNAEIKHFQSMIVDDASMDDPMADKVQAPKRRRTDTTNAPKGDLHQNLGGASWPSKGHNGCARAQFSEGQLPALG